MSRGDELSPSGATVRNRASVRVLDVALGRRAECCERRVELSSGIRMNFYQMCALIGELAKSKVKNQKSKERHFATFDFALLLLTFERARQQSLDQLRKRDAGRARGVGHQTRRCHARQSVGFQKIGRAVAGDYKVGARNAATT